MEDYKREIVQLYEEHAKKEIEMAKSPGAPNNILHMKDGETIDPTSYYLIVEKGMYWTKKITPETNNTVCEVVRDFIV